MTMSMTIPISNTNRYGGSLTAEQTRFYDEEGYLVLPELLTDADMAPARAAMMQRVEEIAQELYRDGLITDRFESEGFATRLAASSRT
jgi:hypothetical protein